MLHKLRKDCLSHELLVILRKPLNVHLSTNLLHREVNLLHPLEVDGTGVGQHSSVEEGGVKRGGEVSRGEKRRREQVALNGVTMSTR